MAYPRKKSIGQGTDGPYHISSRCLGHTVLDGRHPVTGKQIVHRRKWIAGRIAELQGLLAVKVLAASVAEHRVDLFLTCLPRVAAKWKNEEVVWRWLTLFGTSLGPVDRKTMKEIAARKSLVEQWRSRLASVSWFMRGFNEWLARRINQEEERRGQFWAARFDSWKLDPAELKGAVADLEGHRLTIPPFQESRVFPGLATLPAAPIPPKPRRAAKDRSARQPRMNLDQKAEIFRRIDAGEDPQSVANDMERSLASINHVLRNRSTIKQSLGRWLNESEKAKLRKLMARHKPRQAKNGRLFYHPNDVHALAESTFGRRLSYQPFEEFCRQLRNQ